MKSKQQPIEWLVHRFLSGEVIVNIGQVDAPTKRLFDRWAKSGIALKWRGCWYPVAGAPFGIGPLKSCWCLAPGALG